VDTSASLKFFDQRAHVWIIILPDYLAGICRPWYWAGVKAKTPIFFFFGMFTRLTQGQWGEFLWGDPGQDL